MNLTNTQNFPYPDCTDPGDGALDLQILAESIDAKLVTAFAAYRSVVNRPAFIAGLTANQTGLAAATDDDVSWDKYLYNSKLGGGLGTSIPIYQTGYWMIGAYVLSNPSAGVTANSHVRLTLTWSADLNIPLGSTISETFVTSNYQSSTGGEYQTVSGLVRQEFDGTNGFLGGGRVSATIFHNNVASTLNVISTSLIWGFKICELEDV